MRLHSIDALRGMAILGILFLNIPFHAHISLAYVPFEPMLASDKIVSFFYSIFAEGRFRTLFCLIFGAGLAIQYDACKRKSIDTTVFLKTRLHWLLFFGAIHAIFIFGGDILMLYSVVGLFFIKALELDTSELLIKSRKCLIIGCIVMFLLSCMIIIGAQFEPAITRGSEEFIEEHTKWRLDYVYQVVTQAVFAFVLLLIAPVSIFWQILGLMYLGAYLYRTGFFESGFSRPMLVKVCAGAIVTTVFTLSPQLFINNVDLSAVQTISSISAIFVALIYAHIVVKLCRYPGVFAKIFAAPGKVAFSLYIFQSISVGILLRVVLPDFMLTATMFDYCLLTLAFIIIQVIIAHAYLSYFKQGPLEYLWRYAYNKSIEKKLVAQRLD